MILALEHLLNNLQTCFSTTFVNKTLKLTKLYLGGCKNHVAVYVTGSQSFWPEVKQHLLGLIARDTMSMDYDYVNI